MVTGFSTRAKYTARVQYGIAQNQEVLHRAVQVMHASLDIKTTEDSTGFNQSYSSRQPVG